MSADGALFIVAAGGLTLAVAAWIVWPLLRGVVPADPPDARTVSLLARREAALATLRDLDSDFADGRLDEADYNELRSKTVAEGAAALAALDSVTADLSGRATELAAAVEADVARAQGEPDVPSPARDAGESARSPRFCTHCGKEARDGDLFCAGCGQTLGAGAGADS